MSGWFNRLLAGFQNQNLDTARNDLFPPDDPARIWRSDNPVGTETLQSAGMPRPTTYAGPVGQFIDPATGQMTAQGAARMDNPALGLDTGGVVSGNLLGMVRAFHGSPNEMTALDPTRVGTGAMADRWAQGVKHSDEYYLTTSKAHAKDYGDIVHEFEINHPLLEKDAKADLEKWAKDEGYPSAQQHINDYYDGSAYHALDADNYFKDALREAKEAGLPGARISFGDLFSREGRSKVPIGDVIVLHDPSVAVKVPP
jgi:hypothetical protein